MEFKSRHQGYIKIQTHKDMFKNEWFREQISVWRARGLPVESVCQLSDLWRHHCTRVWVLPQNTRWQWCHIACQVYLCNCGFPKRKYVTLSVRESVCVCVWVRVQKLLNLSFGHRNEAAGNHSHILIFRPTAWLQVYYFYTKHNKIKLSNLYILDIILLVVFCFTHTNINKILNYN